MQNAPRIPKHSFLPHLFSCERKDGAVGDNRQAQICDNLSVSAAPSQLPWKGSLGISCFPDGDGDLGDEFFGVVRQAVVDQGDLAGEAVRREKHAVVL